MPPQTWWSSSAVHWPRTNMDETQVRRRTKAIAASPPIAQRRGMDDTSLLLFAAATVFFAGTVKGFVGLGLPMIGMAVLTLQIDPKKRHRAPSRADFRDEPLADDPGRRPRPADPHLWAVRRDPRRRGLRHGLAVAGHERPGAPDRTRPLRLLFTLLSWRNLVPAIPASLSTATRWRAPSSRASWAGSPRPGRRRLPRI